MHTCRAPTSKTTHLVGNPSVRRVVRRYAGDIPHAHVAIPVPGEGCATRSVHGGDTVGVAGENGRRFQGGGTEKKNAGKGDGNGEKVRRRLTREREKNTSIMKR